MTEFTELLFNPITIIASLLAAFFVLMAILRRRHSHAPHPAQSADSAAKPYRVSNPYTPAPPLSASPVPAPAPALMATPPIQNPTTPTPRKVFRQFGQSALQPQADRSDDTTGYIWE